MTFLDAFRTYYVQFSGDSEIPAVTDPEFLMAIQYGNTALMRWANIDGVYWNELWGTLQTAATGTKTLSTGVTAYAAPTDMLSIGGVVYLGTERRRVGVLDNRDVVGQSTLNTYAYVTGNPGSNHTVNIFPAATAAQNGQNIDYAYYKQPTLMTTSETGTYVLPMSDAYFVVHSMLADRFRAERNTFGYQTAKRDADKALADMITRNTAQTPGNPFTDNTGSGGFGAASRIGDIQL